MKICDICDKEKETKPCIINGSLSNVCEDCRRQENIIEVKPDHVEKSVSKLEREEENEMVVPNYAEIVKQERIKLNLTQGDLARELGEKVKTIQDLEDSKLVPTFLLANKLSKFLNIKLIDSYKAMRPTKSNINFKDPNLKIKDLLKSKEN